MDVLLLPQRRSTLSLILLDAFKKSRSIDFFDSFSNILFTINNNINKIDLELNSAIKSDILSSNICHPLAITQDNRIVNQNDGDNFYEQNPHIIQTFEVEKTLNLLLRSIFLPQTAGNKYSALSTNPFISTLSKQSLGGVLINVTKRYVEQIEQEIVQTQNDQHHCENNSEYNDKTKNEISSLRNPSLPVPNTIDLHILTVKVQPSSHTTGSSGFTFEITVISLPIPHLQFFFIFDQNLFHKITNFSLKKTAPFYITFPLLFSTCIVSHTNHNPAEVLSDTGYSPQKVHHCHNFGGFCSNQINFSTKFAESKHQGSLSSPDNNSIGKADDAQSASPPILNNLIQDSQFKGLFDQFYPQSDLYGLFDKKSHIHSLPVHISINDSKKPYSGEGISTSLSFLTNDGKMNKRKRSSFVNEMKKNVKENNNTNKEDFGPKKTSASNHSTMISPSLNIIERSAYSPQMKQISTVDQNDNQNQITIPTGYLMNFIDHGSTLRSLIDNNYLSDDSFRSNQGSVDIKKNDTNYNDKKIQNLSKALNNFTIHFHKIKADQKSKDSNQDNDEFVNFFIFQHRLFSMLNGQDVITFVDFYNTIIGSRDSNQVNNNNNDNNNNNNNSENTNLNNEPKNTFQLNPPMVKYQQPPTNNSAVANTNNHINTIFDLNNYDNVVRFLKFSNLIHFCSYNFSQNNLNNNSLKLLESLRYIKMYNASLFGIYMESYIPQLCRIGLVNIALPGLVSNIGTNNQNNDQNIQKYPQTDFQPQDITLQFNHIVYDTYAHVTLLQFIITSMSFMTEYYRFFQIDNEEIEQSIMRNDEDDSTYDEVSHQHELTAGKNKICQELLSNELYKFCYNHLSPFGS
jgi:hypothetical protein